MQRANLRRCENAGRLDFRKGIADAVEVIVARRPFVFVESGEIERNGVLPHRLFLVHVEEQFEIGHCKFPLRFIYRLAEPQAREIRFRDCPEAAVLFEERDDVVVVADGLHVHDTRWISDAAQRGCGE